MPSRWSAGNSNNGNGAHIRTHPRQRSAPRGKSILRQECELSNWLNPSRSTPCRDLEVTHSVIDRSVAKFNPKQTCISGRTAVSEDRSSVEAVVKSYFDGLYEGNVHTLGATSAPL